MHLIGGPSEIDLTMQAPKSETAIHNYYIYKTWETGLWVFVLYEFRRWGQKQKSVSSSCGETVCSEVPSRVLFLFFLFPASLHQREDMNDLWWLAGIASLHAIFKGQRPQCWININVHQVVFLFSCSSVNTFLLISCWSGYVFYELKFRLVSNMVSMHQFSMVRWLFSI